MTADTTDAAARIGRLGRGAVDFLVEAALDVGPKVPVRDRTTLRAHHRGMSDDAIAESLIRNAARATAAVGAAGGALAAAEFLAPPTLLGVPLQLVTETMTVVMIELKLVAELHAIFGVTVPGNARERAAAYALAWARRRGAEGLSITGFGQAARRELQNRMVRRLGRTAVTLAPMLAGAAAAATLNARETNKLGGKIVKDLRKRSYLTITNR